MVLHCIVKVKAAKTCNQARHDSGRGRGAQGPLRPWSHTSSLVLISPGAAERLGIHSLTHSQTQPGIGCGTTAKLWYAQSCRQNAASHAGTFCACTRHTDKHAESPEHNRTSRNQVSVPNWTNTTARCLSAHEHKAANWIVRASARRLHA
jgi:hypothetical protein